MLCCIDDLAEFADLMDQLRHDSSEGGDSHEGNKN